MNCILITHNKIHRYLLNGRFNAVIINSNFKITDFTSEKKSVIFLKVMDFTLVPMSKQLKVPFVECTDMHFNGIGMLKCKVATYLLMKKRANHLTTIGLLLKPLLDCILIFLCSFFLIRSDCF